MQSLELSDSTIFYHQKGQGSPIILLHGWGGSSRYWYNTLDHLATNHTVYALDLPGYGQSPALDGDISAERFAAILIEFADKLNLATFDLIAHSFGCGIAVHVAAHAPQRIRRLVLTCFSTFSNEFERRMVEQMLSQMGLSLALWQPWMSLWHPWMGLWQSWLTLWQPPQMQGSIPTIYQTIAWRFFYRMPTDDTMLRESFGDFLDMDQRTSFNSIISALNPTINHAMQLITTPTLLIAARQDMIMPQTGVPVVAELIPTCQLEWIDQCGHIPMIEQPDVYHHLVQSFLLEA
jgi:pimeloyl-ACP methyl ester carboxylesterase